MQETKSPSVLTQLTMVLLIAMVLFAMYQIVPVAIDSEDTYQASAKRSGIDRVAVTNGTQ